MSTLRAQADAVELAALNRAGLIRTLEDLVAKKKRPQHDLDVAKALLPDLQAAAATMRRLAEQKEP